MFVAEIEKLPADQRELLATYLPLHEKRHPLPSPSSPNLLRPIYTAKHAKQLDETMVP